LRAYRCRSCRNRFYAADSGDRVPGKPSKRSNNLPRTSEEIRARRLLIKRAIVAAIFASALILFLLFLKFMTSESSLQQRPIVQSNSLLQA